ncbi:MAG: LptF/LptG family permease [Planctomycetota bacterium]
MRVITVMACREALELFLTNLLLVSLLAGLNISLRFLREDIGISELGMILGPILVSSLQFSFPLAAIISTTQLSNRWREEGTLQTVASGGLPSRTLFQPVIHLFAALALVFAPFVHDLIPRTRLSLLEEGNRLIRSLLLSRARTGVPLVLNTHDRLFSQGVEGEELRDLTFTRTGPGQATVLKAARGRIIDKEHTFQLECQQVSIDSLEGDRTRRVDMDSTTIPLETREKKLRDIDRESVIPSWKLGSQPAERVEWHMRFSMFALLPLLAWLGLLIGPLLPFNNRAGSFVAALLPIAVLYYPLLTLIQPSVIKGSLQTTSLWVPVAALYLLGLSLGSLLRRRGLG